MNGFMETLGQFLAWQGLGLAGIVHIGAGTCEELPFYRDCDPEYLVLVDAEEQACLDLRDETGELGYCRVICQAVSIAQSTMKLNQFNNARLNSVLSLEELQVHYPGLKQINTITSPSIPLDEFLKTLDLPVCEPTERVNILFLDNCGFNMEVFDRETSPELSLFDYIMVRTLGDPALLSQAAGRNEHELIQVNTSNLPFVDQVYKNNKKFRKLSQEHSTLKSLLDERERELERLSFSFEAVSDELKSSFSQLKEASSANARIYEELSDYRQTGAAIEDQVRSLEQEVTASGEKLLESEAKVQDLSQKNSFLKSSLDEKDGELEKLQFSFKNLSSEFESISSELEKTSSANACLKEELSKFRQDGQALAQEVTASGEKLLESEAKVQDLSQKNSFLKSSLDEKDGELEKLQFSFKNLSSEFESISSELEKTSSANACLKEELSKFRQDGQALAQEVAASGEKLLESEAKVQDLSQKNSFLKSSLDEKDGELEKLQFSFKNLSSEFESISSELEKSSSANACLKEELSKSRQDGQALEQEIAVTSVKLLESEAKVQDLSQKNSFLKSSLDEQKKVNQEFSLRMQMMDQEIMKTEAQLELVKDVVLREKKF